MDINLQTKIAALLEAYPELEDTLLELSPAFTKLRNPVLRRTVAKVATLQQAAKIANISPAQMVQILRQAAGLALVEIADNGGEENQDASPTWFNEAKIAIRFDARPVIDAWQSPMQEIIRLSKELKEGDIMELIAPFEPIPIMEQLKSNGFRTWYDGEKCYILK
jgi:hypothetical protein